jgi:uncharacterized membrane protein YphA (DoxX/SURF4 family)
MSDEYFAAPAAPRGRSTALHVILWIVQALLAALFLFAGVMKFLMPADEMTKNSPVPLWFIYFIGVAEILGGLGLVLPGLFRIKTWLTPLAAAGLLVIMIGAAAITVASEQRSMAVVPAAVGIFCFLVAYGRWRPAPLRA